LSQAHAEQSSDKEPRGRIKTIGHDIQALTDQTAFLSQKITFLLDATLGLVNIEQNNIIKIFTIAAGVFLPPTLIASVYGMNFVHMPELRWPLGYPLAVVAMVLSAVLPYWYFRRRGWL
jgi:magnesium transporter